MHLWCAQPLVKSASVLRAVADGVQCNESQQRRHPQPLRHAFTFLLRCLSYLQELASIVPPSLKSVDTVKLIEEVRCTACLLSVLHVCCLYCMYVACTACLFCALHAKPVYGCCGTVKHGTTAARLSGTARLHGTFACACSLADAGPCACSASNVLTAVPTRLV